VCEHGDGCGRNGGEDVMQKLIYFDRYIAHSDGRIQNAKTLQFLKPGKTSRGYLSVSLLDGSKPKKPRSFTVHRLILEAFVGKSDLQCNHKNGDKTDNRLENLEYCSGKENAQHSVHVLKKNIGSLNGKSKLTADQVKEIVNSTLSNNQLAAKFGVSRKHVGDLRRGKYWKQNLQTSEPNNENK
jgi:hypothetical protein